MSGERDRRHPSRRRAGLLSAMTVAAAVALVPTTGAVARGPAQAPQAGVATAPQAGVATARSASTPPPGPFVTLLFSRTEISAADNCVEDDDSIARLDTTVAPYLQSLGMTATGTLVTDRTDDATRHCTHYNDDLTASWADATNLAQNYGWTFVSHTATYPSLAKIESLTPKQAQAQTCGSEATIAAHGLPGAAGMIAYPGSYTKNPAVVNLQTQYGQTCFDWGRQYDHAMHGTNNLATASTTPPYWAYPVAVVGGPCNDPTQPCYTVHVQNGRYTMPSTIIRQINRLQPGQWYILQAYILVTGTNPKYTSNNNRWDCTSPDPAEHWTNVTVRYCWSDFQQILQAIAAKPGITVTDPQTIGRAWGRPF
jgi:Polysaccharide deacetylase